MTPRIAAAPMKVVAPEISISHRTLATMPAAAGSSGFSSSASGALIVQRSSSITIMGCLERIVQKGSLMAQGQPAGEEFVTADAETGPRLDRVLAARITELSRTRIKTLILAGEVSLGGRTIRDPGPRVNAGETGAIAIPAPGPPTPEGEALPLDIVYEDDEIILLDQTQGPVVHP